MAIDTPPTIEQQPLDSRQSITLPTGQPSMYLLEYLRQRGGYLSEVEQNIMKLITSLNGITISTNAPLSGGGLLTEGITLNLDDTSPSPAGSYTNSNITVDAKGRVTAASSGGGGSLNWVLAGSYTVSTPVSSIPFTGLGGYTEVLVLTTGLTWSTNVQRIVQVSSNGGTTWDDTAANYPIAGEDALPALPGLGGFFPSTSIINASRGFILKISNFNQNTIKFQEHPSRSAYRFYLPTTPLDAVRVVGVASNAYSGTATAGTVMVFGR